MASLLTVQDIIGEQKLQFFFKFIVKDLDFLSSEFFSPETNLLYMQHPPGLLYINLWDLQVKENQHKYKVQNAQCTISNKLFFVSYPGGSV